MMTTNLITPERISKLFFDQVKKMSIESRRPDATYANSVTAPETTEVSIC